jgi:hypothetical protein
MIGSFRDNIVIAYNLYASFSRPVIYYCYKKNLSKQILNTVKPLYLEHVDNWFLKLVLYYFNKYIF